MTTVKLIPAVPAQIDALRNLWQLYMHDFTEFMEPSDPSVEVDERGLYPYEFDLQRYFERPGFWAYMPRVRDRIAGFVLISDRLRFRHGPGRIIDEFFVLRRYRGQGIGRSLAFQTFDTFRGYWEIAQIPGNKPAQAFWRRVIGDYTDGRFEELTPPDGELWQRFDSSTW